MAYLIALGVAVVAMLVETATVLYFGRAQRSLMRQAARERELLVNQLCNLVGKPWAPAPAEEYEMPEPEPVLVTLPEQLPDF